MNIAFLGITGSGKSTIARAVADELELPYISSGEYARKLAERDIATRTSLNAGALAPENAMRDLIRRDVEAQGDGFVIDGFPRSVAQYIALSMWTEKPITYFRIECEPTEAIDRLIQRGRADDNPDSIARKLRDFELETRPLWNMVEHCSYDLDTTDLPSEDAVKAALAELA